MADFEMPGWQDSIKDFLNKSICDPSAKPELIKATASHGFPFSIGQLTFSIRPEAEAAAVLFNSKDDTEHDPMNGVIGTEGNGEELGAQIVFKEKGAWLAYNVLAGVKAEGGGDIGVLGLRIDGEKVVELCDYHFHKECAEKIRDAVARDFLSMRFAVQRSDLKKLGPNEAMAYRLRGRLSTTIEASLSDVLTANLNGLSSFVQTNTPIAIKFKAGANLKFSVELSDSFLLVFSREGKDGIRIGVKKGKVSSLGGALTSGIEVQLANPNDLAQNLTDVLEGLAGAPVDKVDALLKKNVISKLTDEENGIFGRLLHRFKLDDNLTELANVRTHWENLKKEVRTKIESLIGTRLEAAFRYEYSRVRSEATILQMVVEESVLVDNQHELHSSLIKTNITPLIQFCRDNKLVPEKYMHVRKLSVDQAWGLSISLGKLFTIGGKDIEKLEQISRKNFDGDEQVTFLGQRGYKGQWVGQKVSWLSDFQAGMTTFEKLPRLSDFEFGLHFKWLWEEKKLSKDEVDTYLDYAEIWRAINSGSGPRDELSAQLGKSVNISLEVKIDDFAFRQILKAAKENSPNQLAAAAMAKAMPWDKALARSIVERRTRLYTPLWQAYLDDPERPYRDYAAFAGNVLQRTEEGVEVAFRESTIPASSAVTGWPMSFAEMIRLNGTATGGALSGIHSDWQGYHQSLQTLNDGIAANASPDVLKRVFKGFCQLWEQSLQLRAVGVYWIDLAASLSLLGHVERTMTVEIPKDSLQIKIGVPSR